MSPPLICFAPHHQEWRGFKTDILSARWVSKKSCLLINTTGSPTGEHYGCFCFRQQPAGAMLLTLSLSPRCQHIQLGNARGRKVSICDCASFYSTDDVITGQSDITPSHSWHLSIWYNYFWIIISPQSGSARSGLWEVVGVQTLVFTPHVIYSACFDAVFHTQVILSLYIENDSVLQLCFGGICRLGRCLSVCSAAQQEALGLHFCLILFQLWHAPRLMRTLPNKHKNTPISTSWCSSFTTFYHFWWLLCMLRVTKDTSKVWKCLNASIRQHKAWPEETPTVCFTIWHNYSEGSHSALTRQNKSSDISSFSFFFKIPDI